MLPNTRFSDTVSLSANIKGDVCPLSCGRPGHSVPSYAWHGTDGSAAPPSRLSLRGKQPKPGNLEKCEYNFVLFSLLPPTAEEWINQQKPTTPECQHCLPGLCQAPTVNCTTNLSKLWLSWRCMKETLASSWMNSRPWRTPPRQKK